MYIAGLTIKLCAKGREMALRQTWPKARPERLATQLRCKLAWHDHTLCSCFNVCTTSNQQLDLTLHHNHAT